MAESDSSEIVKEMAEAAAASNVKVVAEGPAFYTNQGYAAALDSAAGWRTINQAVVSKAADMILNTSPVEGGADVAAIQALAKIVQSIPPQTGVKEAG